MMNILERVRSARELPSRSAIFAGLARPLHTDVWRCLGWDPGGPVSWSSAVWFTELRNSYLWAVQCYFEPGTDSLIVRDIALDESGEPRVLGTAFVLKAAASVVTTIAAIIAARFLDPHDRDLIIIVALLSIASISQALDVIDFFFQAQVKSRHTVVPRTIAFVAASLARLAAVFLHAG